MKKLEKLNAKRIEQIEQVLGGKLAFTSDFAVADTGAGGVPTTEHRPTKGQLREHYTCDHTPDVSK
ncbi:hypothetical protein [Sphingobacterium faecium]|uniref:hypothetical protein n=1 Tax=Sphingobacterium faecium TaxID=34087 RepID=UPI003208E2E8